MVRVCIQSCFKKDKSQQKYFNFEIIDKYLKLENSSCWMSITEMISPSLRFLPHKHQYLCTFHHLTVGDTPKDHLIPKVVTPEPIEDNLKETTDKDYLIG
jgi:hypothetical protein